MNEIILKLFIHRLSNPKTKLIISSLSYYAILALIPTFLLITIILKIFDVPIYLEYKYIFDKISISLISNTLVSVITIYMISRLFLIIIKEKFSPIKSIILSIIFSMLMIVFLTLFFSTYILANNYISALLKVIIVFLFLFSIILTFSRANFKYSIIFSLIASIVSNLLLYAFILSVSFFINYENYYGILAPIFLIILAIHLFIYIVCVAYIGAEEFTKISKIKIMKV